ncbi:MAG: 3-isopropylmalate/(R)-2-methylmalate dehydratase small subunit [Chitinophagales bacterium]|jgi:3-isopropylmalate/(R)-2-methylmalate dehydratase small subunit
MEKYTKHTSVAALMNRSNVDTDQIVAKQFLKKVERTGFGVHLFHDWRYLEDGTPNPDFELNNQNFAGSKILVAGDNFGCGSSREHAPWAIDDYGFNTIISTSFADIFYNNCFKNGILPVVVDAPTLKAVMAEVATNEGVAFTVDLEHQKVITPGGIEMNFEIDGFRKHNLLNGLDDIGLSLKQGAQIDRYEEKHRAQFPWLWAS